MRHVIAIRSCFDPKQWSKRDNKKRLQISKAVTVPSLVHQTNQNFEVAVLCHKSDPLLNERMELFRRSADVVHFLFQDKSCKDRVDSAYQGYKVDWLGELGLYGKPRLMTRVDDDDALCANYVEIVHNLPLADVDHPQVFMFNNGYRVMNDKYALVMHSENAMHSTYFPAHDDRHIYSYGHTKVRRLFDEIYEINTQRGWLWVRHNQTISDHKGVKYQVDKKIKEDFPFVDWEFLKST